MIECCKSGVIDECVSESDNPDWTVTDNGWHESWVMGARKMRGGEGGEWFGVDHCQLNNTYCLRIY